MHTEADFLNLAGFAVLLAANVLNLVMVGDQRRPRSGWRARWAWVRTTHPRLLKAQLSCLILALALFVSSAVLRWG